jgi:hypothetical protein
VGFVPAVTVPTLVMPTFKLVLYKFIYILVDLCCKVRFTHNQRAPAWPEGRPQAPVLAPARTLQARRPREVDGQPRT